MVFLFLLALFSGPIDEDSSPGCIPIVVFCISSLLIAIGVSGHKVSLSSVQEQEKSIQTESTEQDDIERKKPGKFRRFFWRSTSFFAPTLLVFVLSYMPWRFQLWIAATWMVGASDLFMRFSRLYKYDKPQESPLTTLSRVFVASISKMFSTLPPDDQLHENPCSSHYLPHTKGLRFDLSLST
jgi:peptide/histidine transporter 3/4